MGGSVNGRVMVCFRAMANMVPVRMRVRRLSATCASRIARVGVWGGRRAGRRFEGIM